MASLALVALAVVLAYANAPGTTFVFDARALVAENPILREATMTNVAYIFSHDYWQPRATDGLYRPLTILSFLVDYAVLGHGDRPAGYVIENVGLHLVCATLVYGLVWQVAGRSWPATVAALLFAVHPITTDAVTNVMGRADLLAAAGVLGGILCWVRGAAAVGGRRVAWGVGLAVATITAFLSKENGLVLVPAVLLYDRVLGPAERRRLRPEHLLVIALLVGYVAARWWVDHVGLVPQDISPVDNPLVEAPFWLGRLTALGVLLRETGLVLWPATLSIDYSYRQVPIAVWPPVGAGDWMALAALAAPALAGWLLVHARLRAPGVCFLGAFAILALLPSANLFRLVGSIMAERFVYLPLVGFVGVAALLVDEWAGTTGRRRVAGVVVAGVLLAAGVRTAVRNQDWRDERTLWAATVRAAPESAKAHKAYASALAKGATTPGELAVVVARAEQAVAIRPDYQSALVDLGGYQIMTGDALGPRDPGAAQRWYDEAVTTLEAAAALDRLAATRFTEKMRERGHADETIPQLGDHVLYNNLSLAYVRLQRLDEALGAYRRLRQLSPLRASLYRDMAALQTALGRQDDAAVTLLEAITVDDGDQEAKQRLVDLYRAFPAGDAPIVTDGPDGDIQIHTAHPVVRRHRCRAWGELADLFTQARMGDAAAQARAEVAACATEGS